MLPALLVDEVDGSLCVHQSGNGVSDARSDLLLQSHAGVPEDVANEIRSRLPLASGYFEPSLFHPTFECPELPVDGPFPKSVVVLSILPDLSRVLYRHRASGYLVDPGSAWLNRMAAALEDLSFVGRFKEAFEPLGRITVERFRENYRRLIPLIHRETGASILVLNALEVEPSDLTHDYSLRNLSNASRGRRFNLALDELAAELDFRVLDVDRVLKEEGVQGQVDFSHFPVERMRAVAIEAANVLRDAQVV